MTSHTQRNVPHRAILTLFLLAACDASPSPKFFGATETRTSLNGRDFSVFHDATSAEVVRLGWASPAKRQGMMVQMILAAEQVTGCKVRPGSLQGDSGALRVSLACPKLR